MGDAVDNFPGCPGVGEKTAVKLINEFGSIDGLLEHTNQLKGKMREKVEGAVEDIKMSKFLATIRTDVPIELNLEALRLQQPDEQKLSEIFADLEFKTLANKILNKTEQKQKSVNSELDLFAVNPHESQVASENASFESLKTIKHDYQLIENQEEAHRICDFFRTKQILSLDTETTSTNPIDAELVGLSFSVEERKAFYVPVPNNSEEAQKIVNIFKPLYEDPSIVKVGQNIKYDLEVLQHYDVELKGQLFDK